ncbi:ubiquitin-like superfamily protein [Tasmannia lanceolata]|uniref:ubiquitin-like superfamily protein n=1 Tax=Tasmannia lanceolata TaxID=3420 RepID=UPI004062EC1A
MESSTTSLTFKGSISEAIVEAQAKRRLFLVYISGEDENSILLEQSTWTDINVAESISRNCVFLHLRQGSIDASHFCAIYPPKSVPTISAIGYIAGKLLWQLEGYVSAKDLVAAIEKTCTSLHLQETAATVLTAALTSKKPEPSSSSASNVSLFEQENLSSTDVPSSSTVNPSLGVTGGPSTVSELSGENITCAPIVVNTQITEETSSQSIHVNAIECGRDEQSISASETAKDFMGPITINVDNSQVESGSSNVWDGSIAQQDNITLNGHDTVSTLESSGKVPMEYGSGFSGGSSQIITSKADNIVHDKKSDGLVGCTNVTKSNVVHLNIRLPDGATIQAKFSVSDTLRLVKNYVNENQMNGTGSYDLAIPYPRKVFNEQDMCKTLSELGLVNREALIVVPHHQIGKSYKGESSSGVRADTSSDTDSMSDNSGGYFAYVKKILSYMNPLSYLGGSASSSSSGPVSDSNLWQYRPNPGLQNSLSGQERSNRPYSPNLGTPPTGENDGKGKKLTSTRFGSNIHTLKHDEDDGSFSDRNAFWNGNSTQYGGDNNK